MNPLVVPVTSVKFKPAFLYAVLIFIYSESYVTFEWGN